MSGNGSAMTEDPNPHNGFEHTCFHIDAEHARRHAAEVVSELPFHIVQYHVELALPEVVVFIIGIIDVPARAPHLPGSHRQEAG